MTQVDKELQQKTYPYTPPFPPSKLPIYVWGSGSHVIHGSLGPPNHIPNGTSMDSAIFAQLTAESPYMTR